MPSPTVYGPLPSGITLGNTSLMIPQNNDPNVVGSSTYNPNAGFQSNPWWYNPDDDTYTTDDGGFGGYNPSIFGGEGGDSFDWGSVLGGAAGGLALGSLLGGGGGSVGSRNLTSEISGILGLSPIAAGSNYAQQAALNPLLTQLNTQNFGGALYNVSPALRAGYDAANPQLAGANTILSNTLGQVNGQTQNPLFATGYAANTASPANAGSASQATYSPASFTSAGQAAQASFTPSTAYTATASQAAQQQAQAAQAAQQRASGGALFNPLQRDAASNLGQVSQLQGQQQQIAQGLLNSGGALTPDEVRQIQQDTRAAYASRGLGDSNVAIASEALNQDAARRQRLLQNISTAQGIDTAGQNQLNAGRSYALGVQNQGQALNQFNAGQGNALNQYNAGLQTGTSQFNAGQGNAINTFNAGQLNDISRFNANLQTQNSQYNSGLGAQLSQFNAGAQNQQNQFNSAQQNALSQYNAGLGANNSQFNAGANNQMAQYNAGLDQQGSIFNAGANNTAQQYNVGAVNAMNLFNAQNQNQTANDQWNRALQFGNFQLGQSVNPAPVAMGLMGQAPDYTSQLLGYGSDLFNTNYNSAVSQANSRNNNNAALTAAGLNLLYNLYGRNTGG